MGPYLSRNVELGSGREPRHHESADLVPGVADPAAEEALTGVPRAETT